MLLDCNATACCAPHAHQAKPGAAGYGCLRRPVLVTISSQQALWQPPLPAAAWWRRPGRTRRAHRSCSACMTAPSLLRSQLRPLRQVRPHSMTGGRQVNHTVCLASNAQAWQDHSLSVLKTLCYSGCLTQEGVGQSNLNSLPNAPGCADVSHGSKLQRQPGHSHESGP